MKRKNKENFDEREKIAVNTQFENWHLKQN